MRLILILFSLTLTSSNGWAQGQIGFANLFGPLGEDPRNAPIFDVDCQTPLAGNAYSAQAYVGLTEDSLQPLGPVVGFFEGIGAGFVRSTIVTVPGVVGQVYFQIRAWETAAGASYDIAVASGGKHGFSNIVPVEAIPPLPPPGVPIGLESFCLVPEPSTLALLICSCCFGKRAGRRKRARLEFAANNRSKDENDTRSIPLRS